MIQQLVNSNLENHIARQLQQSNNLLQEYQEMLHELDA
jgi:hypothetical protein